MALLDQLLAGDPGVQNAFGGNVPAAAPDPGTGVATAPPTMPTPAPIAVPSITAPGGALDQALTIGSKTAKAGVANVMANPLVAQYQAQQAKTDAANKAASDAYAANMAQIKDLNDAPPPERISVPKLAAITPESADPAYVAAAKKNPLQTLGMFLPILAALGGMKTQNFANGALQAATGALNGAQAGDEAALKQAHDEWLDNTKAAIDSNAELASQYKLALDDRSATMSERIAKVAAIAAENKDVLVKAALDSGHPENVLKLIEMTETAGQHLQPIVVEAQNQALAAARAQDEQMRGWAELRVRQYQADVAAGKTSPNDVGGQLFAKMAKSGYDSLTDNEKGTLAEIQKYEVGLHPSPQAQIIGALTGAQPAAPATTPAAVQAAAGAAAAGAFSPPPVTADTGAGAVATGLSAASPVIPANKAAAMALKPGTWFKDPAGNIIQKK